EIDAVVADRVPAGPALFRVIRAIRPGLPPIYANVLIEPHSLCRAAHEALQGDPRSASAVRALWRYRLLPVVAGEDAPGGRRDDLHRIHRRWVQLGRDWRRLASRIPHAPARATIAEMIRSERLPVIQL